MGEREELLKAEERIIRRYLFDGKDRMPAERALDKIVEALRAPAQSPLPSLPEIPDEDADFTPDLARKIIGKYQQVIAALRAPEAAGPHLYAPDIMLQGDCMTCGNVADHPWHKSAPEAADAGAVAALDAAKSLIKQKIQKLEWSRDDCQSKGQAIYVANLEAQIEGWTSHLAALSLPSTNGETGGQRS